MTPQLWKRNLSWPEWRQMHPHLEDKEAENLYQAEYQLFENYQSEIRNQTLNRKSNLVNQINYLSNNISNILIRGKSGEGSSYPTGPTGTTTITANSIELNMDNFAVEPGPTDYSLFMDDVGSTSDPDYTLQYNATVGGKSGVVKWTWNGVGTWNYVKLYTSSPDFSFDGIDYGYWPDWPNDLGDYDNWALEFEYYLGIGDTSQTLLDERTGFQYTQPAITTVNPVGYQYNQWVIKTITHNTLDKAGLGRDSQWFHIYFRESAGDFPLFTTAGDFFALNSFKLTINK